MNKIQNKVNKRFTCNETYMSARKRVQILECSSAYKDSRRLAFLKNSFFYENCEKLSTIESLHVTMKAYSKKVI